MTLYLRTSPVRQTHYATYNESLASLRRDIARAFDEVWPSSAVNHNSQLAIKLDVKEDEKAFHVAAELPGLADKDVDVSFQDNTLTIRGEKKIERDEKADTWHISERSSGSFTRQLELPSTVDADTIAATFTNGLLNIVLPKKAEEQAKAKKVSINKAQ